MGSGSKPAVRGAGALLWHNSGALGMPANDGTPRVWFSVISPREGGIEVTVHGLDYEHIKASRAVFESNFLNRGYGDALKSGVWPSLDILPAEEFMATGHPLDAALLGGFWPVASPRAPLLWLQAAMSRKAPVAVVVVAALALVCWRI